MLIGSNLGAFFTIADFLLILYLANKIHLDNIQLGTIAFSCILVLFYWLFINKETYDNSISNPNVASLIIFTSFCVCISFLVYCLSSFSLSKWTYHIAILIIFILSQNGSYLFIVVEFYLRSLHGQVLTIYFPKRNLPFLSFWDSVS